MKKLPILIFSLLLIALSAHAQRYRYGGYDDYTEVRVGVQGGWSYRTAAVSKDLSPLLQDYMKGLKSGYNYGADATFFFNRSFGIGITYSGSRSSNLLTVTDTISKRTGNLVDNIVVNFIAPSFMAREIFGRNDNFQFWVSASIGYLSYKDDALVLDPVYITGSTVGLGTSLGFDIGLTKSVFIGAQLNSIMGSLSKLTVKTALGTETVTLEGDKRESLSRIDVSGGLRINL